MLGKKFELWQYEHVKNAYEDQMGVKHDANVIRRKVIVTVVEVRNTKGDYSGETIPNGYLEAEDEDGNKYINILDETSMCGRRNWSGPMRSWWTVAESRGWFTPYMNPDGTKAVPQVLDA